MATTNFTPLLGLALPTTGDLSGTWGTEVNNAITSLLDSAVAGTTTLNTDTDVTLSTTNGAANQARSAIIVWTASGSVTRNITAPAQSKTYLVINATGGTQSIVLRGAGPTSGVTIPAGTSAIVAWNGSDFVRTNTLLLTSPLSVVGNSSAGAEIRLPEDTDNGSNYIAVKAPDSLSSNFTTTLPDETCTLGFRNIPQNSKSADYTLVLTDSGKHILHPSADTTNRTFTIPANSSVAFPIGTAITFINQDNAGVVTIAITSDTMRLAGPGTTGSRTLGANGIATAIKITSTEWIISGVDLT